VENHSGPFGHHLQDQEHVGLANVAGHFTEFNGDGRINGNGAVSGRLDIRTASATRRPVRRYRSVST